MKRKLLTALAVLGFGAFVAGPATAQSTQLTIATGGTGGVYYPLGGGLGNIITHELKGVTATAEVTGGSVDNLKLVDRKSVV